MKKDSKKDVEIIIKLMGVEIPYEDAEAIYLELDKIFKDSPNKVVTPLPTIGSAHVSDLTESSLWTTARAAPTGFEISERSK